jgi:hypothetical protein
MVKFKGVNSANLATPTATAKLEDFNRGWLVQQKFMLSSNFMCDQNYFNHCFELGHTYFRYLRLTLYVPQTHRWSLLKIDLHYGNYRSKLVHLEAQKIFYMF